MIRSLFARLTADRERGSRSFGELIGVARERHWYVEGEVPNSVDGRFAMLSTVIALAIVRLENGGEAGRLESVALTERFIEAMDSEHREMGVGDPAISKTVRKLVGSLATRVDLWRETVGGPDWNAAAQRSVYRDRDVSGDSLGHSVTALRELWWSLGDGNGQ